MKKKKFFFALSVGVMALVLLAGCSKHHNIVGPEIPDTNPPSTPVVEYHAGVQTVDKDNPSVGVSGVAVYTLEGVPAVYKPWPASGRNVTDGAGIIEPNDIAPGDYVFIGVKAGYDTARCFLHIPEKPPYVAYLVMHKKSTPPLSPSRSFGVSFDPQTKVLKFKGTVFEECADDTLVLDGSSGPLVKIAVSKLGRECNTWYVHNLSAYLYRYTRVTFIYGQVWHYHTLAMIGVPESEFELVNAVKERPQNDQWFTLCY